ncbi:ABC transporter permease [Pseudarthrobacter oxydans]|uniref:ABC transporter permease n=1 Tax=Pseudarthrobacter oxydans TaxID=1671 RepID=UPI003828968F
MTATNQAGIAGQLPKRAATRRQGKVAEIRELGKRERLLLGLAGIVAILAAWEIGSRTGVINPIVASSPTGILEGAMELSEQGVLLPALGSTARLFAIGFGISLVGGLVIGAITGWYVRASAVVDPWISILYASPRIAFLPLIAVWFGPELTGQIVVVVLIAIFPIIINVASGVASVDRGHLRMARSFLATNRDVLMTVALPGAIPAVASGIRQGMMQGLLGVVVAEYFLGGTGIGGVIFQAGLTLKTGQAMLGALIFAAAAIILTSLLRTVESRLDKWRV